ncbi:MAG: DUF3293 domain-containing protein [Rhodopila sp.]
MTPADGISASLRRAYRMTRYEAAGVTVRIGVRSAAFDNLLRHHRCRAAVFISADNPRSKRMPPAWNRRMLTRLRETARRRSVLPARGTWQAWQEAHLLVLGDPRPALRLARMFRQNAVVIVRLHQGPRIILAV